MLAIETLITTNEAPSFFTLLHSAILKFTYFHALDTIRRQTLTADVDALCLVEAQECMHLLQLLPQGDFAHIRLLLDIIISACTLMLQHSISDPTNIRLVQHLELVEPVFTLLDFLHDTSRAQDVARMAESLRALKTQAEMGRTPTETQVRVDEMPGGGSKTIGSMGEFVKEIQELASEGVAQIQAAKLRGK
jgi:hypothetical protein